MTAYSKLIAAAVGLLVMIGQRYGFDLSGHEAAIVDAITAIATAFAVYQAPNKEKA